MISHDSKILFSEAELADHDVGIVALAPGFENCLKELRIVFNEPMIVNSCCRSALYNVEIGGHSRSLHVWDDPHHPTGGTAAIDIHNKDADYAERLIKTAWELGWSVGVANTFTHLDRRSDYIDYDQTKFYY